MPYKKELHQLIHSGSIETQITLVPTDSNRMEIPRIFYIPLNRNSYLPLYFHEMLQYFKEHLLVPEWAQRSSWWLRDADGVPLRWNIPIGVLYDTLTGLDPVTRKTTASKTNKIWNLELCYRNYPENEILPLSDNTDRLHELWLNLMKESCFIMNGSSKAMMKLSKDDTDQLWEEGVVKNDLTKFMASFEKIIPNSIQMIKRVPLRVYVTAANKIINIPIDPYYTTIEGEEGEAKLNGKKEKSLLRSMNELLPDLFPNNDSGSDTGTTKPIAKVIIHGIEIPILNQDITLIRLFHEGFFSVDGFLHISVVLETSNSTYTS